MLRKIQTCLAVSVFGSALFLGFAGDAQAIEGLKFYGDARARFEMDDRTRLTGGVYEDQDRDRFRYRLRVGLTYAPVEQVEVGARVTSGDTTDANSPHVILGSNNNSDGGTAAIHNERFNTRDEAVILASRFNLNARKGRKYDVLMKVWN